MADGETVLAELAKRLETRGALTVDDFTAITTLPCTLREFEPNQYLLREGDRPKFCSFLVSGFVFRHKIVADGGRQIVSVHTAGDMIDLQNMLLPEADHNIQALTASTVAQILHEDALALSFTHPNVGKALWRESLIEASIFREWVANVGRRDARARTAHTICELATRREVAGLGARETYELPMTQEQLGDALGLTSVHVNRTLKTLQDDGLIVRRKRSVAIANWEGLRAVADFTSNYLHLGQR
ncbi:MAG: Crp/Fnr family transcriptional regulator [Sphingomonas bacterium]|uniref:Crp/Fnr family transcriptional regulator n=1 Tax=Sphingomonas bacterium TaxID=1895847 RepID=UPI0026019882|nr:Crp/Fnr family transcriptional regulator [Sphingomonas bacterium]MDB5707128.1 Crp/Fnr family transcriptional regulator [Sphingomonas bacterium]